MNTKVTDDSIKNASPRQVSSALAEYNKWRRGVPPYEGTRTLGISAHQLGMYIDRAVELLESGGTEPGNSISQ